ncbi:MAG TPA: peptidylprolyl isomerase [Acidimicrobiales bacterium]|nr:peptidylprolyl isomerase [Acidimicrobiales bacterium]
MTETRRLADSNSRAVDTEDKEPLAFSLVPSEKRTRQRAMRQVKVAHEQRRANRMKQARRILSGLVVVAVVILLVVLLSNKPAKKVASPTTTTTVASSSTATTSPASTTTTPGSTTTAAPSIVTVSTPVAPVCPPTTGSTKRYIKFTKAPPTCISTTASYKAEVTTDIGTFVISLSSNNPVATNNFVFLSRYHFYDSTIFHRVVPGFMDQGGDPTGTGTGGPGYAWTGNTPTGSCSSSNSCYPVGTVAMANSGATSSNGSQFFIMAGTSSPLPANYTVLGTVTSGLSVVEKINADGNANAGANGVPPVVTHHIVSVTIVQA